MINQAQALRRMVNRSGTSGPRIAAITSGKGGVGKTNVSVNLSLALLEQGFRVLLVDVIWVWQTPILCWDLPNDNLTHVLTGTKLVSEILVTGPMA